MTIKLDSYDVSRDFLLQEIKKAESLIDNAKLGVVSYPNADYAFQNLSIILNECSDEELSNINRAYWNTKVIAGNYEIEFIRTLIDKVDQKSKEFLDYQSLYYSFLKKARALIWFIQKYYFNEVQD